MVMLVMATQVMVMPAGDGHTGDGDAGDGHTGDGDAGDGHTGDGDAGDGHTGDGDAGDAHTGVTVAIISLCEVKGSTITNCRDQAAIESRRRSGGGDGAADTDTDGTDGDATSGGGIIRVVIRIMSLSQISANTAALKLISNWKATHINNLQVTKSPTSTQSSSRRITILAAPAKKVTRWEPKRGVIDGQGCITDGCLTHRQPYFLWTRLVKGNKYRRGGMLYFEWRGPTGKKINEVLLGWVALLLVILVIGYGLKNTYHKPLNGPISNGAKFIESFLPIQLRLYCGTLFINLWIIGWCLLCFLYVWNHATINNLVGKVSRGIGGVVAGLLVLQLFPVSRQSVLLWVFGIPFERALAFHRRIGGWIFTLTTIHFIAIFADHVRYYRLGTPRYSTRTYVNPASANRAAELAFERLFRWEIGYPHGPPAAGFIAWSAMIIVALGALPYVRRKYWKVFAVSHAFYVVVYVMSWIHYPSLMIYCGVPVLLYVVDLIARHFQATIVSPSSISEIDHRPEVTKITIEKEGFSFLPTQYILLMVPRVSCLEWHPFTISSRAIKNDDSTHFTIHVKRGGHKSWTSKLQHVDVGDKIFVQGPFGNPTTPGLMTLKKYKTIVMCCGGVGITPALAMIDAVANNPDCEVNIDLVWAARGEAAISSFGMELALYHLMNLNNITFHLYNTSEDATKTVHVELPDKELFSYSLPVRPGRPDFYRLLERHNGTKTAVFACGPSKLVSDAERAAYENGFDFHQEVFEL
eukprot:TRINITY_DN2600_c0_g2_i1.p1 TRINITY_DN2600_c0_g2~~TRINITY_DN2600_c0_g2_i1.p1  ORF type:complete len:752 (+),score=142.97 TRINITY_DN2600_c0_g2_i1:1404-3659(+)